MNERHFEKLIKKSPYWFYKGRIKENDGWIRNENGTIWVDEFGCTHWITKKPKIRWATFVEEWKLQPIKNKRCCLGIRFAFSLADDSKIEMKVNSFDKEPYLSFSKYISYKDFRTICKWGLYVNPDEVRQWEIDQIKRNKELIIQTRLQELENDFNP